MRRKDRELSGEEAALLLEQCEYGVLSLVTPDSKPYSVPVNYVYLRKENAVYIHCATEGEKLVCIEHNANARFSAVKSAKVLAESFTTLYESAIADGTAVMVTAHDEKKRVLLELCQKYEPDTAANLEILEKTERYIDKFLAKTAIIKINVSCVFGKANR